VAPAFVEQHACSRKPPHDQKIQQIESPASSFELKTGLSIHYCSKQPAETSPPSLEFDDQNMMPTPRSIIFEKIRTAAWTSPLIWSNSEPTTQEEFEIMGKLFFQIFHFVQKGFPRKLTF
jgi:hypothetical protein